MIRKNIHKFCSICTLLFVMQVRSNDLTGDHSNDHHWIKRVRMSLLGHEKGPNEHKLIPNHKE